MGIKRRGNSAAFYANRRAGGRFVSTYLGSGAVAEMLAAEAREKREAEARRRAEWAAERAGIVAGDRSVDEAGAAVERAVRLILEAAGYHRLQRGRWRRRRKGDAAVGSKVDVATLKRAQEGNEEAGREVRRAFADDPRWAAGLANSCGDRALANRKAAVEDLCGRNLLARASVEAKVEALRAELAGPTPTTIERLLAERAAGDWLTLHIAEERERDAEDAGSPIQALDFHRRRVDSRHRRYLASLKALAAVRRIDLTAVQLTLNLPGREAGPAPAGGAALDVT